MPVHIVLVHPEIPPNTGNIIRLAANSGAALHLVKPLGFVMEDKHLRRAGLDYHDAARVQVHDDLLHAAAACGGGRQFAVTSEGQTRYDAIAYQPGDVLLFGGESQGLPAAVRQQIAAPRQLYIPMRAGNRSLNLSNAVSVIVMEAWRQLGFCGAAWNE